ncbi:hypothetical protein MUK42_19783 [Musa troglodytarum]|uniref:Uncharacterized protein n=1 Tax=Musa troglodytarum TaxID=320322 RepID=A0A9E7FUL3_9LILI|nr:hypothetical protein MUK42_19783 [Musa troglodytarum]
MAKQSMDTGPAIQPSWAVLHASESTPEPMTAVMMCATQVVVVIAGSSSSYFEGLFDCHC